MDIPRSISNASRTSPSELPSSGFSSVEPEPQDPFAQSTKNEHPFTTIQSFRKALERRHQELLQDQTQDQYLVFTSVPPAQFPRLSQDGSRTSKYSRICFNAETGILIVKVMPTITHELAIRLFDQLITFELQAMNLLQHIDPLGSTTIPVGNWKKEADCSWGPASVNTGPSFVVEVGLSESTRHLALDAHGWLETPSSSVQLAVTINITRTNPEIVLRRWELTPRRYSVRTRSSPSSAQCTALIKISRTNNATSVTGEFYVNGTATATRQLNLPFAKITGRNPQPPLERDFVIPEQALENFAEGIWRRQGLL
ncbi:hypothetical protein PMG11_08132 [Penicillium brasilianum]|uniref:Uncharacterized protein n=1 Tax=Penicillium brasilianum TaxID=104259 RepID=A0A0F7TRV9_PENBI|nr:hypothetical protein PMG11_08132 [Penicillium brasilianum]